VHSHSTPWVCNPLSLWIHVCVCVLSGADCARHVADVAGLSAAEVQQSLSSCRSRGVCVCVCVCVRACVSLCNACVCISSRRSNERENVPWFNPAAVCHPLLVHTSCCVAGHSTLAEISVDVSCVCVCVCVTVHSCTACSCDLLSSNTLIGSYWSSNTRQATLMRCNFHWVILSGSSHQSWPHLHQTAQFELTDIKIATL